MAQSNGGGGLVKIALVGVAGWFGYNYLVNSGLWAQLFGGGAAPIPPQALPPNPPAATVTTTSTAPPASTSTTPAPPAVTLTTASPLAQQLNALALQYQKNMIAAGTPLPPGGLTIDEWLTYYNQLKGQPWSSPVSAQVIQAAGVSDGTTARISLPTFVGALNTVGLSGYRSRGLGLPVLARSSWGAPTPSRALPPNYVRRGSSMIRRR